MLNQRGFIGPIGDDLPSLIPLLFGLVIFFSTFTVAFNSFDARNTDFKDDLAVMKISRILQSNSYIYSHDNFEELCEQIGVMNLKFIAGISADAQNSPATAPPDIYSINFFSNGDGTFYCSNTNSKTGSSGSIADYISSTEISELKVVTRIFPIVVEDSKIVKPMHLYVVAWK